MATRAVTAGFDVRVADLDPSRSKRVLERIAAESSRFQRRDRNASSVAPQNLLDDPCTVFSPCAVGGVIDAAVARSIQAQAVVGGANRILADNRAGKILFERGVRYAPDFVVNSGAVIRGARFMLGGIPASDEEIGRIGQRAADIWGEAIQTGTPPEEVALRRAQARVLAGRQDNGTHGITG